MDENTILWIVIGLMVIVCLGLAVYGLTSLSKSVSPDLPSTRKGKRGGESFDQVVERSKSDTRKRAGSSAASYSAPTSVGYDGGSSGGCGGFGDGGGGGGACM